MNADSLVPRMAALHERHIRLLALEITAVVDELLSRCPGECADPVFTEAWARFSSLRGTTLRRALEEPALEVWKGQVQTLLGSPALRTCPGHHVPRALARLSALMIHLAGCGENLSQGTAVVLGSASIPALLGTAQLRPASVRRTLVHWTWVDGLRLRDENGHTLVELSVDGHPPDIAGGGWRVERAQMAGGIQVFAEPRCAQHPGAVCVPGFAAAFSQACDALPHFTQRLLRLSAKAAGPRCDLHPLDARSWLGVGAPSPEELAHALAGSLVDRCARVYRFDSSSQLTDALGVQAQDGLVAVVARELLSEPGASDSTLDRMLAVCEARTPVPPPEFVSTEPGPVLDFRPILTRADVHPDETDLWIEHKHRQRNEAPDWRILEALLSLSRGEIARLRTALAAWPEPEIRHFGLACAGYHEGSFADGAAHVLACIEADHTCEDYWLLLALHARHLRLFGVFDDIVFHELRSNAMLERIRKSLGGNPCS